MPHVFVSYAHEDRDFVKDSLLKKLESAGFEVWADNELRVGNDWREGIDDALQSAFALVLVMTPNSKSAEYVIYEWVYAWISRIEIVPLLLEPETRHPRLEPLQFVDFTNGQQPWDNLIKRLQEIKQEYRVRGVSVPPYAPTIIKNAAKDLDNSDLNVRRAALDTLANTDDPLALEALADAIGHRVNDVRVGAALHFARLTDHKDSRAVPGLMEALLSGATDVRGVATTALEKIGQPAVPDLLRTLYDADWRIRRDAAAILGIIGDACAVPGLIESLHDENLDVGKTAVKALGRIRDARAVPVLIEWLLDKDDNLHEIVVWALQKIGTPEALEALKERGL